MADIQIPNGALSLTSSSGNVAAATATATFAAPANGTNYMTGFIITGAGATAASVVVATITGLIGGTMSFVVTVPAGATTAITPLAVTFPIPVAAAAPLTAITLTLPSLGAGNTNAAVTMTGFRL